LLDITSWYDFLRSFPWRSNIITGQVLNLVDRKMLLGKPENKMTAKEICAELKKMSTQAEYHSLDFGYFGFGHLALWPKAACPEFTV
jgi:hypothetical protein